MLSFCCLTFDPWQIEIFLQGVFGLILMVQWPQFKKWNLFSSTNPHLLSTSKKSLGGIPQLWDQIFTGTLSTSNSREYVYLMFHRGRPVVARFDGHSWAWLSLPPPPQISWRTLQLDTEHLIKPGDWSEWGLTSHISQTRENQYYQHWSVIQVGQTGTATGIKTNICKKLLHSLIKNPF